MNKLNKLPNIGKILAEKLEKVGITNFEELKISGSQNAFLKLVTIDQSACLNMLYALEGAIQGIRWHQLSVDSKAELKEFYHFCNAQIKVKNGSPKI